MSGPNLAALVKERMDNPREWPEGADPGPIGRAALRQMYDTQRGPLRWRMSGLGKCARALAYIRAERPPSGRRIDARSRLTFSLGDMTEAILVHALSEALQDDPTWGLLNVGEDQTEVRLDMGEDHPIITGHPDGIITRSGRPWAVLEIKSTASYGFQRASRALKDGLCPWDESESYWWQTGSYMEALNLDRAGVLMLCKDSGAVLSFWVHRDPDFRELLRHHLDLASGPPESVPRVLPNGQELKPREDRHRTRGTPNRRHSELPWQCRFCAYHSAGCWPNLVKAIGKDYRGAPSLQLFADRPDMASL